MAANESQVATSASEVNIRANTLLWIPFPLLPGASNLPVGNKLGGRWHARVLKISCDVAWKGCLVVAKHQKEGVHRIMLEDLTDVRPFDVSREQAIILTPLFQRLERLILRRMSSVNLV